MAIRTIRIDGDPILRKTCREVKKMTPRIEELVDDMFDTMYEANGVGLAAPQVGVLRRIVVIDVTEEGDSPILMINPQITERSGEQCGEEGCLSLPGLSARVTRPNHIRCRFFDSGMNEQEIEAEELLARAICHEVDHLDGILYKDIADEPVHPADQPEAEEESGGGTQGE